MSANRVRGGLAAAIGFGALFGIGTGAQAFMIDRFDITDRFVLADGPGGFDAAFETDAGPTAPGEAVGGHRALSLVDYTGSGAAVTMTARGGSTGTLELSAPALAGASGKVTWNAGGSGLGGVDITDGGASNAFRIAIVALDMAHDIDFIVSVTDTGNNTATGTALGDALGSLFVPFSSFGNFVNTNFAEVNSVMLTLVAQSDEDVQIDFITTAAVPLPPAFWLMGSGLLGLPLARRKRQNTPH